MREILFRGKRVDNGEWVEGDLLRSRGKCYIHMHLDPFDYLGELSGFIKMYEVVPETVGQYTGFTDKNGKQIFERDICNTNFESYTRSWDEVGVVTEFCGAYGIESAEEKRFRAFINESVYTRSHEIIGNIHDNPELLKGDRQ